LHIGLNLPPKDNIRKEDKSSATKVSFIRRFHCITSLSQSNLIGPPTFRWREQEWNRPFTRPISPVWRKMVWEQDYQTLARLARVWYQDYPQEVVLHGQTRPDHNTVTASATTALEQLYAWVWPCKTTLATAHS